MTYIAGKIIIDVAADTVWQVISDFGTAGRYVAGVVEWSVAGAGVGALRTLTYRDGSTIVERLEVLDEVAQRLSYCLLTDTPFGNCLTTMAVRNLDPGQAELAWSATFQPDGLPESEAVELLEGALAANCVTLKQFMEAGRQ